MTKKMTTNKPLKWTKQRINFGPSSSHKNNSTKPTYRVYKRNPTPAVTRTVVTAGSESLSHNQQIECLERELAFTCDAFATITVHFESLYHAYTSCKPELDKSKTATRLGEMEKELLTAYDDLGLQVTHLERKITKLESRLSELRQAPPSPASPCSSVDTLNLETMDDMIYQPMDCMYSCQPPFYQPMNLYDQPQMHFYDQPTYMI